MCANVRAPLVPRPSWLGRAAWVCVLGLGFRLCPATPGWGVGVRVCLWERSTCTPPLLPGVCGAGVGALAQVAAAPCHSWLGCWGVCVFVCAFRLYPAPLGRGGGVCVCCCACSACTPPLLTGVCGVVLGVWAGVSAAPRHSWLGRWGVRVCVPAPPVPRHSWPGCAAWVFVLGLGFRLRPASACSSWPGRAGRPPGRVLVRLTFSFGRFGFLLCLAPSRLGLPPSWSFFFRCRLPRAPCVSCFL